MRPAPLSEVAGLQERDQRRTAEQIEEFALVVQILDVPVPQNGGALEIPAVLEQSIVQSIPAAHVVERASRVHVPLMVFPLVDVPKISLLHYEFHEEILSRHGSPNGDEDEDHV